jgi:glycosyltransferase involved in cell wall biosynthesis
LTRHVLFPLKPFHKFALRRVGNVIAVSNAVADSLKSIFPSEKITIIHNGIDVNRFFQKSKKPPDKFTIGTIGHLSSIKGQTDFVRAAAIIAKKRDDVNFVIIGEDKSPDKRNRIEIENLITELNLQNRVQLLGWIEDVRELYASFDLFVSSARAEPFGLVIVEAMASGVPVVATKSEGALEIIENDKSGKLVEVGDIESLAQTIIDLLTNPVEREQLAANARQRVCEKFSLEKMVEQTEVVYQRLHEKQK